MTKSIDFGCMLALGCLLLAAVSGRSHFPARYHSQSYAERENSLSPSMDGSYENKDIPSWVKVSMITPLVSVAEGGKLELICEASGSPSPSIKWSKTLPSGRVVDITGFQPFEHNDIKGPGLGKVVSKYVVDCVHLRHLGSYTCLAIAADKAAESQPAEVSLDLDLEPGSCKRSSSQAQPPKITVSRPVALENWNNNIVLPCTVRGNPQPTVAWIDEEKNNVVSAKDTRYKVLDNGDLLIKRLRWEDMGRYTCVAENYHGRDTATTFLYPMKNE